MAKERIRTPTSMAGILSFYDTTTGGPALDPRGIIVVAILFIVALKLVEFFIS